MSLLSHFTVEAPELGLSEMARLAVLDKATTLRLLAALQKHGFVEQHPETKKFRLGANLLRLARLREASFPVTSVVQPVLERVASATGETAHASLASGSALITIGVAEPHRSTRVHLDPSELLPFHATASGIAYLAYAADGVLDDVLKGGELRRHTEYTEVAPDRLREHVALARARGFAVSARSYEAEVIGVAAPIFDASGRAYGAIAVASLASRFTPDTERATAQEVIAAAVEVTRAMGAEPHPDLLRPLVGSAA